MSLSFMSHTPSHFSVTPVPVIYYSIRHYISCPCTCHSFLHEPVVHSRIYHYVTQFSVSLSLIPRTNDFTPSSMFLSSVPLFTIMAFSSPRTCHLFFHVLFCYMVLHAATIHYPSDIVSFSHSLTYHLSFSVW